MNFLIFIAPNGFKDETLSKVRAFFDKWGIKYKVSSYSTKECRGYHGAVVDPDINTNKVNTADFDGIILLDGPGIDQYRLQEFRPLLDLILRFNTNGKYVAAVGNSLRILARSNTIKGKKVSVPNDDEIKRLVLLFHGIPSEEGIEGADNVISIGDSGALEEKLVRMMSHIGVN